MRGRVIVAVALAIVTSFSLAHAQRTKKVARIGYLSNNDPMNESPRAEIIRSALRELGYIEGQNIVTEYRYTEGKLERVPELAAELVRLKVDLILVAGGPTWIQAAKNATQTIPIIMIGLGADPVRAGYVDSLARPGGNVTGITSLSGELGGKRLELLKQAVPKITRVAAVHDTANPATVSEAKKGLQVVARVLRLTVRYWEVRAADDFERVFPEITNWGADGLYPYGGPLIRVNGKRIVDFALKSRLPSVYLSREWVEAGGFMSYGADPTASSRRVAYYVDKILKGAKPADLPIEQPTKVEFVMNLKAAKQIGLTIPPNVLARADRVIK
jgi:putative ABC transport system substrate-binding protein